jgi:hypothetical protein
MGREQINAKWFSYENSSLGGNLRGKERVRPELVIEAAALAASGHPFEVVFLSKSEHA